MSFPLPAWLENMPENERFLETTNFRYRLARLYAGDPDNKRYLNNALREITHGAVVPHITIPKRFALYRVDTTVMKARNGFIVHAAAIYATQGGKVKSLSALMGFAPAAGAVYATRNVMISPMFCRRIEDIVGKHVLPRTVLNPDIFA